MRTFVVFLGIAAILAMFLVAAREKEPYGAFYPPKAMKRGSTEASKWMDKRQNQRESLVAKWEKKLSDSDAKLYKKGQAAWDRYKEELKKRRAETPLFMGMNRGRPPSIVDMGLLTEAENVKYRQLTRDRIRYVQNEMTTKCNPRLWHGNDFDVTKYKYAVRVEDKLTGGWTCDRYNKETGEEQYDTGCSWQHGENASRQCGVYIRGQPVPV
jgi:hypothetical protein